MSNITVFVKDPYGNPIQAKVVLTDTWGNPINAYTTDASGKVIISASDGLYLVHAEKEGFSPSYETFVRIGETKEITLWLREKPTTVSKPSTTTVAKTEAKEKLAELKAKANRLSKQIEALKLRGKDASQEEKALKEVKDAIAKWEGYEAKISVKGLEAVKPSLSPVDQRNLEAIETKKTPSTPISPSTLKIAEVQLSEASKKLLAKFFRGRRKHKWRMKS